VEKGKMRGKDSTNERTWWGKEKTPGKIRANRKNDAKALETGALGQFTLGMLQV